MLRPVLVISMTGRSTGIENVWPGDWTVSPHEISPEAKACKTGELVARSSVAERSNSIRISVGPSTPAGTIFSSSGIWFFVQMYGFPLLPSPVGGRRVGWRGPPLIRYSGAPAMERMEVGMTSLISMLRTLVGPVFLAMITTLPGSQRRATDWLVSWTTCIFPAGKVKEGGVLLISWKGVLSQPQLATISSFVISIEQPDVSTFAISLIFIVSPEAMSPRSHVRSCPETKTGWFGFAVLVSDSLIVIPG